MKNGIYVAALEQTGKKTNMTAFGYSMMMNTSKNLCKKGKNKRRFCKLEY